MEEIYNFLKEAGVYYIGTINNNKPDIRPFGTINIFEDKLYIQTGKNKNVYKQIKENSNVYICTMLNGKWIRIKTELIEDNRIEAEEALLKNYPELSNMYAPGDGNTVVFYLKNVEATINSFTEPTKEIKF